MQFDSRKDAGEKLAKYLEKQGINFDVVFGLPRGGIVVGYEVARKFNKPLDVLIVRKIGHPYHREFAVGAIAEGDILLLDKESIITTGVDYSELEEVISEERERLVEYRKKFGVERIGIQDKEVLIVDDGIATGSTVEAGVNAARKLGASRVYVSAPVSSDTGAERLRKVADEVFVLLEDPFFAAVGNYYKDFRQIEDYEVIELLKKAKEFRVDNY